MVSGNILFLFLSKPLYLTEFLSKACAVLYSCELVVWEIPCLARVSLENSFKLLFISLGFLLCYLKDPNSAVWPLKSLTMGGSFGQTRNTRILKDNCSRTILLHSSQMLSLDHLLNGNRVY